MATTGVLDVYGAKLIEAQDGTITLTNGQQLGPVQTIDTSGLEWNSLNMSAQNSTFEQKKYTDGGTIEITFTGLRDDVLVAFGGSNQIENTKTVGRGESLNCPYMALGTRETFTHAERQSHRTTEDVEEGYKVFIYPKAKIESIKYEEKETRASGEDIPAKGVTVTFRIYFDLDTRQVDYHATYPFIEKDGTVHPDANKKSLDYLKGEMGINYNVQFNDGDEGGMERQFRAGRVAELPAMEDPSGQNRPFLGWSFMSAAEALARNIAPAARAIINNYFPGAGDVLYAVFGDPPNNDNEDGNDNNG